MQLVAYWSIGGNGLQRPTSSKWRPNEAFRNNYYSYLRDMFQAFWFEFLKMSTVVYVQVRELDGLQFEVE